MPLRLKKIISGGQTGVDQAGLEAAKDLGYETGGHIPRGGRIDGGYDPTLITKYGLTETQATNYQERTELNVKNSDLTVIFQRKGIKSPGSDLTIRLAKANKKPFIVISTPDGSAAIAEFKAAIEKYNPETVNIAGHRESSSPDIQKWTRKVVNMAVTQLKEGFNESAGTTEPVKVAGLKKSNRPAHWDRPDKGGKKVLRIVQPGDPAPIPRRGVYRGAPKSTPPLEPIAEPTQTELNHVWANLSPTEDLNVIKKAVDKLVKGGKIRADAAPVVLTYAVYAREEILGLEKGESRSALKKFVNENYFFDSGTRAAKDFEEEGLVDFARASEDTSKKFIGKERGPLTEENREKLLKSLSGKSGKAFVNATLDQAVESGSEPDDSAKRAEKIERILGTKPPEKPIKVSEGPLKRRPRQRSRIVVDPPQDPEQSAKFRMELAASGGKVPDVEFSNPLSDAEASLRVGSKAFTKSSEGKPEEERVKVLKRFPDGKVLVTTIDKAAELWDASTVGGASTKWEGSEAETEWARSMGLNPDSLKYGFDNNGKRYLAGSKAVDTTRTEKAKGALAFNLIKNKLFGEKKATEPDTGEPSVIMEDGKPVTYPPNSPLAGKPRTYPQRSPKQKARSKAKKEQRALGRGPADIVKAAVESQRPEPFSIKKERALIKQELLDESPELYEDEQQLKRRIKEKLDFVIRTRSGEALEGTPKPAEVPEKIEVRSKEPLKISEEPSGKKFKVKGQASLSPRILGEPTDLPEGRAVERKQRPIPVTRQSDIAPRVRLSDARPPRPYLRRDRYGQARMSSPESAARILSSEESAKREQERIEAEKQKKVSQRKKKESIRAFMKNKPLRYLMALVGKIRR